jgi:hypothetical protein
MMHPEVTTHPLQYLPFVLFLYERLRSVHVGVGGPAGSVHLPPDRLHLPQPEEPAQDHQWQVSIVKFRVLQLTSPRPLSVYVIKLIREQEFKKRIQSGF